MEDSLVKRRHRISSEERPDLIPVFNDPRIVQVYIADFSTPLHNEGYGMAVEIADARGKPRRRAVRYWGSETNKAIAELKEWLGTV